jgi:hypothetical protein
MWIVCINNGICEGASSDSVNLTIGRQYRRSGVKNKDQSSEYRIVNDIGEIIFYSSNRFVSVTEYREKMLGELLEF